jgi:hypothetical protein
MVDWSLRCRFGECFRRIADTDFLGVVPVILLTFSPVAGTMIIGAEHSDQIASGCRAVRFAVSPPHRISAAGVRWYKVLRHTKKPAADQASRLDCLCSAPATRESSMPEDHPAYRLPNYGRLFRQAVAESVRDYYREHRELLIEGYWLLRLRKRAPWIPARTYWTHSEPGNADNLLDRWPLPFLAGEIAGDVADPLDIFGAGERTPLTPRGGLTIEQEYRYRVADMRHAKHYRPEDPLANPRRAVDLTRIPPIPPPGAPE